MADRIAVMSDGKMLQVGTPKEIYEHPTTHFVADFIGETNFVPATLEDRGEEKVGKVRLSDGTMIDAEFSNALEKSRGDVMVAIRPERVGIAPDGADLGMYNTDDMTVLTAKLVESQYIGTDTRYTVQIADGVELVARLQNVDYKTSLNLEAGQTIKVFWHHASTTVLDR